MAATTQVRLLVWTFDPAPLCALGKRFYHAPSELGNQSSTMLLQSSGYLRIGSLRTKPLQTQSKTVRFVHLSSQTDVTTSGLTFTPPLASRQKARRPRCNTTLCPSGLRGWTQVPLARAAWVQIPQVSYSFLHLLHIFTLNRSL